MYLSLLIDELTARRILDGQRVVGAIYHCGGQSAYLRPYATSPRKPRGAYSRSAHGCVRLSKKEVQLKLRIRRDERLCHKLDAELRSELWELQDKADKLLSDESEQRREEKPVADEAAGGQTPDSEEKGGEP